jgi:ABC-type transport system involved in multi-copper enzyme maturation permease subunit
VKQVLHIFAKDARHFWPEILVSLALTAAFARLYPYQWLVASVTGFGYGAVAGGVLPVLANALVILVPISWWLLISRAVHGERLVGNTQFWLTRPYEWKNLLAAKLLFLLAFLYLPLFIAQCLLLAEAGFHPLSYLPGLLFNLLLITGVLVLPLAALSSVTSSFAKMTLVLLGVVVLYGGIVALSAGLPSDTTGSVASPLGGHLALAIVLCACGTVLLLQYAARKTLHSWLLLVAIPVLLCAIAIIDPDQRLMNRTYPRPAPDAAAPVQFQYLPNQFQQAITNTAGDSNHFEVDIPLRVSGVADGSEVNPEAVKVAMEAADGSHWESPWQAVYDQRLLSGTEDAKIRFRIRREAYEKFKSMPVRLHVTLALALARVDRVTEIPLPASDFAVPNFGVCSPRTGWFKEPGEIIGINCRVALRQPKLTYVSVLWSKTSCSASQPEPSSGVLGAVWVGLLDNDPAEFGITSVWQTPLNFSNIWESYQKGSGPQPRQMCPGSPVTFTQYSLSGRTQTDLTIQDFHLPGLAIGDTFLLRMR